MPVTGAICAGVILTLRMPYSLNSEMNLVNFTEAVPFWLTLKNAVFSKSKDRFTKFRDEFSKSRDGFTNFRDG